MTTSSDEKFRIFISHKEDEHDQARKTKEVLEGLSPKISCFVSGVDIPAGADWNQLIKSALGRSNLLLLLFSNPNKEWDWCLYEAGLYTRFDSDKPKSVVTIYNPEATPPGPLESLQAVPAEFKKVRRFLKRLCKTTKEVSDDWKGPALNEGVSQNKLNAAAKVICQHFRHATTHHPCHRVVLDVSRSKNISEGIPDDARVVAGSAETSDFTLFLFGLSGAQREVWWGDLLDGVGGRRALWRRQLDEAFLAAMQGSLFVPGSATLRSWDKRKAYKPILYRVQKSHEIDAAGNGAGKNVAKRHHDDPVQLTIVLERDQPPIDDAILSLVCTGKRYEVAVFKPFCDQHREQRDEFPDRAAAIAEAIRFIETDASEEGILDGVEVLRNAMGDSHARQDVDELSKDWQEARETLERALEQRDAAAVERLLTELRNINRRIAILATEYYLQDLRGTDAALDQARHLSS